MPASAPIRTPGGRKGLWVGLGIAGLAALAGLFLLPGRGQEAPRQSPPSGPAEDAAAGTDPRSTAVLPFADMSQARDQEYFSDGISEELLNLLSKVPQLKVTARTSSFSFKGKDMEIPEIARQIHVAHLLEGSVRKSGDRVRTTAQLIHAADGFPMWSQTYDRTLDDILKVRDELDLAVATLRTLLDLSPDRRGARAQLGLALLLKRDAARALAALIARYEKDAPYPIACVYAFRGEVDKTFEWPREGDFIG